MADFLVFGFAVLLGFAAAVPIGPVQIEAMKRSVAGHLWAAEAVVAGSMTVDIIYGAVALFGIAPILERPRVSAIVSAAGALILWVLAFLTWRRSRAPHGIHLKESSLRRRRWGYLTGLLLGAGNPSMILSWVLGVALARRIGLATPLTDPAKAWFIAGGALGLGGYLTALSVAVHRVRHFVSADAMGRVYAAFAVLLVVLSLYFLRGAAALVLPAP